MNYSRILNVSKEILQSHCQGSIRLRPKNILSDPLIKRNGIIRCEVENGCVDAFSVILKCSHQKRKHLSNEYSGLSFLSEISSINDLLPKVYGYSADNNLIVMEDCDVHPKRLLADVLDSALSTETTTSEVEKALVLFQRGLARLHTNTIGYEKYYRRLAYKSGTRIGTKHRIYDILMCLDLFGRLLEHFGASNNARVKKELEQATLEISEPGLFLGFTHGDSTFGNVFCGPDGPVFIDFETGGYRHILLDGTFSRIRYLHSYQARMIPQRMQYRMQKEYRAELIKGFPAAADDVLFNRAYISCSVGWLAGICQFIYRVIEDDKTWGASTYRQRIIHAIEHFLSISAETNLFPALEKSCRELLKHLSMRWPDTPKMRTHQAFSCQ